MHALQVTTRDAISSTNFQLIQERKKKKKRNAKEMKARAEVLLASWIEETRQARKEAQSLTAARAVCKKQQHPHRDNQKVRPIDIERYTLQEAI